MPIIVLWDDIEKTIIRQSYVGDVTIEEYYEGAKTRAQLALSVDHSVDMIVDISQASKNIKGLITVARFGNKDTPPNLKSVVIIGGTLFIRRLVDIIFMISPKLARSLKFVDTSEEAYAFIKQSRENRGN